MHFFKTPDILFFDDEFNHKFAITYIHSHITEHRTFHVTHRTPYGEADPHGGAERGGYRIPDGGALRAVRSRRTRIAGINEDRSSRILAD